MRRPAYLPLILLLTAVWAGCSDDDATAPVEIRVRNTSSLAMQDVVVTFPGPVGESHGAVEPGDAESGDVSYGTVQPGTATPYRTIARAYRYAAVSLVVEGNEMALVPDDYVGEDLLERGRYTYELHYEGGSLGLTLARD